MILSGHFLSVSRQALVASVCFMLLVACNSTEKHAALCESHFKAKSYKIALKHCQKATEKGDVAAQYYLGMIYVKQDKKEQGHHLIEAAAEAGFDEAIFHQTVETLLAETDLATAQQAVKRMQAYAEAGDDMAQHWMGNIFLFGHAQQKRSPNEASYWYQLAADQNNLRAMNNLAWIKALARDSDLFDPEGAIRLAKRVVHKYPKSRGYLDTLAAAYAANGQFEQAVEVQRKVVALATSSECKRCTPRVIEYYQGHLDLYLQQKPLEEDLLK